MARNVSNIPSNSLWIRITPSGDIENACLCRYNSIYHSSDVMMEPSEVHQLKKIYNGEGISNNIIV